MTGKTGVIVGLAFAWSVSARAEAPAPAARPFAPSTVELRTLGPDASRTEIERSLREAVVRVGLSLGGDRSTDARTSLLARVTLDLRAPEVIHVTVEDGRDGHIVVERNISESGGATVAREDAVLVVRSALDALMFPVAHRAEPAAPVPVAVPPPASTPAEPPRRPASSEGAGATPAHGPASSDWGARFTVAPFVRIASLARGGGPLLSGGATATLAAGSGALHPSFSLVFGASLPETMSGPLVTTHVNDAMVRGLASLALIDHNGWALAVAAGAGADVYFVGAVAESPSVQTVGVGAVVDPVATAALHGAAPLGRAVGLTLDVGVDGDLSPDRFVAAEGAGHTALFAPLPVRPFLAIGVQIHIAGGKGGD